MDTPKYLFFNILWNIDICTNNKLTKIATPMPYAVWFMSEAHNSNCIMQNDFLYYNTDWLEHQITK